MCDRILVPLDGSVLAETVVPYALGLARSLGYRLTLLQVVPRPQPLPRGWPIDQPNDRRAQHLAEIHDAREYLTYTARRLAGEGVPITTDVVSGDPVRDILTYTDWNERIALIAMATHGRSGFNRLLFGSVAEQVLARSPVPLLLIRAAIGTLALDPPTYRTILVPLDGSTDAEEALDEAQLLARGCGARLVLLSVLADEPAFAFDVGNVLAAATTLSSTATTVDYAPHVAPRLDIERCDDYLQMQAERLRGTGVEVVVERAHGDPRREISAAAAHYNADLIVMTTHGREDLLHHWKTEVALPLLHAVRLPIVFVRV